MSDQTLTLRIWFSSSLNSNISAPESDPPSYSQVISETSRENDNDTLHASESIEEVIYAWNFRNGVTIPFQRNNSDHEDVQNVPENVPEDVENQDVDQNDDNDSITSADTVNSVQRVQSV